MAWHTLNEAVKLTGRSRRSIYRDMDRGLVSYGLDVSGKRQFETSELMRAYGALVSVAQPDTPDMAHLGTSQPWDHVMAEILALRKEIQELRATILLIEHKPESPPVAKPLISETPQEPATWSSLFNALDD